MRRGRMSRASNQMRQLQSSPSKEHGVLLKRLSLHSWELQEAPPGLGIAPPQELTAVHDLGLQRIVYATVCCT